MMNLKKAWDEKVEDLGEEYGWKEELPEKEEEIQEYLTDALSNYIKNRNNYVVNGAVICCDQMSRKDVIIEKKFATAKISGEMGSKEMAAPGTKGAMTLGKTVYHVSDNNEIVRKLSATHAKEQTSNGIRFATVTDRICLRAKEERGLPVDASIVSMGNCKIFCEGDVEEIEKRKEKALLYGTCYCLIKPGEKWINPPCIENLANSSGDEICVEEEHHKTMEWSTLHGDQEGLTMFSTLLCTRGGIITVEDSGQIEMYNSDKESFDSIFEFKERYEELIQELIERYDVHMEISTIGKIMYVESSGDGYDEEGKLTIRFENHVFLSEIENDERKVNEFEKYFQCEPGNWRNHKIKVGDKFEVLHGEEIDNDLQYLALEYAKSIDSEAAYRSISMGVGQLMGFNYDVLGYMSAEEMFEKISSGYANQIEGMIKFIKKENLDEKDIEEFFRNYNGDNVENYMERYVNAVW